MILTEPVSQKCGCLFLKINAFISQNDQCVLLWIMNVSACLQYSFCKKRRKKKSPAERLQSRAEQRTGTPPSISTPASSSSSPVHSVDQSSSRGDLSLCITGVTVCPPAACPSSLARLSSHTARLSQPGHPGKLHVEEDAAFISFSYF